MFVLRSLPSPLARTSTNPLVPPPPGQVWWSADGAAWTQATAAAAFAARWSGVMLVLNNQLWLLGGWTTTGSTTFGQALFNVVSEVWASSDGVQWAAQAPMPGPNMQFAAVAFGSGILTTGGFAADGTIQTVEYAYVSSIGSTHTHTPALPVPSAFLETFPQLFQF